MTLFTPFHLFSPDVVYFNLFLSFSFFIDFPGGSDGKASAYNAGDPGSIPGLGRSSGEGNGNPLQYSCLGNLQYSCLENGLRSVVGYSPWGHKESDTTGRLHFLSFLPIYSHLSLVPIVTVTTMFSDLMCVVCVLSHFSCADSLQPYGVWPTKFLCPWDFPGKNTRVGCHALLQGIFLTKEIFYISCIDRQVLCH